jgi:hypothetical protein
VQLVTPFHLAVFSAADFLAARTLYWQVNRHGNGFQQLWSPVGPTVGCVVYEKAPSGKLTVFSITMALDNAESVLIVWMKEYPKTFHKVDRVGGRRATI